MPINLSVTHRIYDQFKKFSYFCQAPAVQPERIGNAYVWALR